MTTEQAYFFTVALINLVLAFSGTRIKDPDGNQKSIQFFILAISANFLSWFIYIFDIGIILKIISVILATISIWGMVIFSFKRCEQPLPVPFISFVFSINCTALAYFTYTEQQYKAFHVSGFFVPLALTIISYLFLKTKKNRNPSDIILAYACLLMALVVITRSLLLEISPSIFSTTILASQIIWPSFSVITGVFALLSFTEEIQHKLQKESNTDQLTGLANRRRMDHALQKEWSRANRHQRPLTVIMLDLDFFKYYNDTYGHQAGDHCLKKIADILQNSAQRAGDLAARYGGEEFILILPDTDLKAARSIAQKIRDDMAKLGITHQHSLFGTVTLSAGIAALTQQNYENIEALLRAADAALYKAKRNGRNQAQIASNQNNAKVLNNFNA